MNTPPNNSLYSFNPALNPPLQGIMPSGWKTDDPLIGASFNLRANFVVFYSQNKLSLQKYYVQIGKSGLSRTLPFWPSYNAYYNIKSNKITMIDIENNVWIADGSTIDYVKTIDFPSKELMLIS